jgi:hypothetical protein
MGRRGFGVLRRRESSTGDGVFGWVVFSVRAGFERGGYFAEDEAGI